MIRLMPGSVSSVTATQAMSVDLMGEVVRHWRMEKEARNQITKERGRPELCIQRVVFIRSHPSDTYFHSPLVAYTFLLRKGWASSM